MKRVIMYLLPVALVIGLGVSGVLVFMALQALPTVQSESMATAEVAMVQTADPVAYGKELFLAKGCIVCHRNDRVAVPGDGGLDFADVPNLTSVKIDPDYLRRWLHDPEAMKAFTTMPNLELSDSEIDALVAFLLAGDE